MIQSNLDRHRSIIITKKNEKCSTSIYLASRLDYCFFCQLQRKLGLFKKVFMLVALVNHSLCWRLVYTSGAPLITSLVSWGTQPQLTRVHNFKHFPSQALWISKGIQISHVQLLSHPRLPVQFQAYSNPMSTFPIGNFESMNAKLNVKN